jgi:hypothetical protein
MQGTHLPNLPAWRTRAVGISGWKNEPKRTRVGLAVSVFGHSTVLVAILLCSASRQSFSPEVIPISVITSSEAENLSRNREIEGLPNGREVLTKPRAVRSESEPTSSSQVKSAQTLVREATDAIPGARESNVAQNARPPTSDPSGITDGQEARVEPEEPNWGAGSVQSQPERYLWNPAQTSPIGGGIMGLVEERVGEPPGLTITRSTDWQANPVEDDKLTYSAPGGTVKLTVREAYSAGFAGPAFTPGFGTNFAGQTLIPGLEMNHEENSEPFGLTPAQLGADRMAKSQRLDWTVVNFKNFGVTAFGYQNEVGRDFQPFGQTKNEFTTAGTSTMKAGGQVRVGPFGFGFAESSLENAGPVTNLAAVQQGMANLAAVRQEASVTLDLPHLLPGTGVSSGVLSKLLPTLWVTGGNSHPPTSGQEAVPSDTVSTSFGGSWTWDIGHATLGYWNYSSAGREGLAASAWTGQGFDANFGASYSSFGIDVDLSYGRSADVAPAWQSAGALYSSSVTVSYKPDKLPGLWASAAAGNYDQNALVIGSTALPYGATSSDLYGVSTNGEYYSVTAGLDLTSMLWGPEALDSEALTGQRSSLKLLYRYSDNLYLDSSAGQTRNVDNLVAMMIQRKF